MSMLFPDLLWPKEFEELLAPGETVENVFDSLPAARRAVVDRIMANTPEDRKRVLVYTRVMERQNPLVMAQVTCACACGLDVRKALQPYTYPLVTTSPVFESILDRMRDDGAGAFAYEYDGISWDTAAQDFRAWYTDQPKCPTCSDSEQVHACAQVLIEGFVREAANDVYDEEFAPAFAAALEQLADELTANGREVTPEELGVFAAADPRFPDENSLPQALEGLDWHEAEVEALSVAELAEAAEVDTEVAARATALVCQWILGKE